MKKLISGLSALLTVAMLIPPMSAFAATEIKPDTVPPEGGLTVKYDVDPSYTVTIPAGVDITTGDKTASITLNEGEYPAIIKISTLSLDGKNPLNGANVETVLVAK